MGCFDDSFRGLCPEYVSVSGVQVSHDEGIKRCDVNFLLNISLRAVYLCLDQVEYGVAMQGLS